MSVAEWLWPVLINEAVGFVFFALMASLDEEVDEWLNAVPGDSAWLVLPVITFMWPLFVIPWLGVKLTSGGGQDDD